jgi:hypothetical protein
VIDVACVDDAPAAREPFADRVAAIRHVSCGGPAYPIAAQARGLPYQAARMSW